MANAAYLTDELQTQDTGFAKLSSSIFDKDRPTTYGIVKWFTAKSMQYTKGIIASADMNDS